MNHFHWNDTVVRRKECERRSRLLPLVVEREPILPRVWWGVAFVVVAFIAVQYLR